jgi:Flp pilus assembly protein TadD
MSRRGVGVSGFVSWLIACSMPWVAGCADVGTDPLMPANMHALAAGTDPTVNQGLKHNQIGLAHLNAHEYDAAIAEFDQAAKLAPAWYGIYINRGDAHVAKQQYDLALRDFDEAARLKPDSFAATYSRARAWVHKGDYDQAIRDLDLALRMKPDLRTVVTDDNRRSKSLYEAALSLRAQAHLGRKEYPSAIADYDRAIELSHEPAELFNGRCWARATANRELDRALADCNAALTARPDDAGFLDRRSLVYLRLGEMDRAVADASASLERRSSPQGTLPQAAADAFYVRAVARRRLGDIPGGDVDLQSARQLDPDVERRYTDWGVRP